MTACHLIICERSNRWTAALRTALTRNALPEHFSTTRLDEVRGLVALAAQLAEFPGSLAILEVTPKNFDAALTWLADATRTRRLPAVALLDRVFSEGTGLADVAAALREAGASEIIVSPRELQPVLTLCQNFLRKNGTRETLFLKADQSIENWAWTLLTWQDAGRPVG